ncbi:hypothetical protein OROGR_022071 [Orobanche gracilis]
MAEKNKKKAINGDEKEKDETDHKNKKENNDNVTVVLTADLHCEGCVSKVLKCIRSFDGVEKASIGDKQRITVVGKVDPLKLRERLEKKTHKKVEIISPPLKKDREGRDEDNNAGGNDGKNEKEKKKKKEIKGKNSEKKNDTKKSKEIELPVTTAVLRVHLHCHGCTQKIYRLVTKTKVCLWGYQDMKIDKQKELVTVTGAMDINVLAKLLKKHLKKEVEILPPPKKEIEHKDNKGGDKPKGGGDKGKIGGGGGVDKGKIVGGGGGGGGGEGGGEKKKADGGEKAEGNKSKFQAGHPDPIVYGSSGVVVVEQFQYNPCELGSYHAPQIFSDENPNACSVM